MMIGGSKPTFCQRFMASNRLIACDPEPKRSNLAEPRFGLQVWVTLLRANESPHDQEIRRCWRSWRKLWMKKTNRNKQRQTELTALRKESERVLTELIRRRLALPVEKRLNFLRVRVPGGGSYV